LGRRLIYELKVFKGYQKILDPKASKNFMEGGKKKKKGFYEGGR